MATKNAIRIEVVENCVRVLGRVGLIGFRNLLATLHNLSTKSGYNDLVLDFSMCEAAYTSAMLAVSADVMRLRRTGVDFRLVLPTNTRLAGLFRNVGWANLIDPERHAPTHPKTYKNVPAINFCSPHEQNAAVNRLIDALLGSMAPLERADLAAIEWSLAEITDNVMVHSGSDVGGLVQLTAHDFQRRVEFAVADAGVGIPATLRQAHPELSSDSVALERAIREGVTRDKAVGQGNGLFGSFEVTRASKNGYFHIHSRHARLDLQREELHIRSEQIPYRGSLVVACMDCSNPKALGEALRFGGRKEVPYDYVDYRYEQDSGELLVVVKNEVASFGSRTAGQPLRLKLVNLTQMHPGRRVAVDFGDVPLISSSFADEVIGKLFVELGPLTFMKAIEVRSESETVRSLIDRAIMQRSHVGLGHK
jgi:anti-sigma regulatory factor (Ser/Thr protein kinase)